MVHGQWYETCLPTLTSINFENLTLIKFCVYASTVVLRQKVPLSALGVHDEVHFTCVTFRLSTTVRIPPI